MSAPDVLLVALSTGRRGYVRAADLADARKVRIRETDRDGNYLDHYYVRAGRLIRRRRDLAIHRGNILAAAPVGARFRPGVIAAAQAEYNARLRAAIEATLGGGRHE